MFMVVGLCSFSFNINYDENIKVVEKHDIKPKGAISADGFNTSTTYNLNSSGNSTTHYIQNLPISVGTRSGSTQVVTINAPYTIYSATQYIYGHTDVSCSSGTNTSSTNDVTYDIWSLDKNDQPYITSPNDITVAGYNGDTFVQNLTFTLTKGVSHASKYYLQNLQINVTLVNAIDNYKLVFSNVHFTTGYNTFSSTQTASTKHITRAYAEATYHYYLYHAATGHNVHHDEVGHNETSTTRYTQYRTDRTETATCDSYSGNYCYYTCNFYYGYGAQFSNWEFVSKDDPSSSSYRWSLSHSAANFSISIRRAVGAMASKYVGSTISITFSIQPYTTYTTWVVDQAAYDEWVQDSAAYTEDLGVHTASWGNSNSYTSRDLVSNEVTEQSHQDITTQYRWNGVTSVSNGEGTLSNSVSIYNVSSDKYLLINTTNNLAGYGIQFERIDGNTSSIIELSELRGSNYNNNLYGVYIPQYNSISTTWNRIYLKNSEGTTISTFTYGSSDSEKNVFTYSSGTLSATNTINDNDTVHQWFGNYFLSLIDCSGAGNYTDKEMCESGWTTLEEYYEQLNVEYKTAIDEASVTDGSNLASALTRYDYIVFHKRYNVNDFLDRENNPTKVFSSSIKTFTPFALLSESENDLSTIIIIAASSICLLSITALSVLMVRKKKKYETEI